MQQGCNQVIAVNFDPTAQVWDQSCMYVYKVYDTVSESWKCIWFKDPVGMENKSFTISYSAEGGSWVFFHDYIPEFYFHTREKLNCLKDTLGFQFNEGLPGIYGTEDNAQPFFIDVVFKTDSDFLLETVTWMSSVQDSTADLSAKDREWFTLTHITIWNSQQHTGRIALSDVFTDLQYTTSRKTKGSWSMNDFRNILADRGVQFVKTLFDNYALDTAYVAPKEWYEKELIEDKYCVVRFEFDNSISKQLTLHDTGVQGQKSIR